MAVDGQGRFGDGVRRERVGPTAASCGRDGTRNTRVCDTTQMQVVERIKSSDIFTRSENGR